MTVSDAIYGPADRYVSRKRLEDMLTHEHRLNIERLSAARGDNTAFFAFADTVSARNFAGTNDQHGWVGVRFQVYPRDQDSQILMHVRLLDPTNQQQQEALGIVGVNLLYGAFFLHHEPDLLLESLFDDLGPNRIEISMLEFSGIGFRAVDNRLTSLKLVQKGLSKAAMFSPDGKVLQPSEVFYKRPVLVERGSFRPVTNVNLDILRAAREKFARQLPPEDRDRIVSVAEITMRNLLTDRDTPDTRDFLQRADVLSAAGLTVLVSDYSEFHRLAAYLRKLTSKPLGVALGAVTIPDVFDPRFYADLDGGLLEALGRLFRGNLTLFVYPYCQQATGRVLNAESLELAPDIYPLYDYARRAGMIVSLDNHQPECMGINSRHVLKLIAQGDPAWENMVPEPVAKLIKERKLFGLKEK
jgi:hypothetical protein